jgi:hypothetical protein
MFFIAVHEFINTSCSVDEFHLACIKRMGGVGDLQLEKRIFLTVVHFYRLFCGSSGTGNEIIFVRHILKYNKPVILRMDIFLHCLIFLFVDCFSGFIMVCKVNASNENVKIFYKLIYKAASGTNLADAPRLLLKQTGPVEEASPWLLLNHAGTVEESALLLLNQAGTSPGIFSPPGENLLMQP